MTTKSQIQESITELATLQNDKKINFENVYSIPYIKETVDILIISNNKKYPMLRSYEDDIKQDMLIYLSNNLECYDATKSNIETFSSLILKRGLNKARRKYFSKSQKTISLALSLDEVIFSENQTSNRYNMYSYSNTNQNHYVDTLKEMHNKEVFYHALSQLSKKDKLIAKEIMKGKTLSNICDSGFCSRRYLFNHGLSNIKKVFNNIF